MDKQDKDISLVDIHKIQKDRKKVKTRNSVYVYHRKGGREGEKEGGLRWDFIKARFQKKYLEIQHTFDQEKK